MKLFDLPMFSFTEQPRHAVDYVTPNHFTSTHPMAIFTNFTIVQRWEGDTQVGLVDGVLKERRPDFSEVDTAVDAADLGDVLRERFGLALPDEDVDRLRHLLG